ncbi:hypothetical protein ThvES_00021360, partial [Thiovulum sp. ES]
MTGRTKIEKFYNQSFRSFIEKGIDDNLENRYKNIDEISKDFN